MSLRDVISEIADDMEAAIPDMEHNESIVTLRSYAKQLRRALKASEGERAAPQQASKLTPEMQHVLMIEEERNKIRAAKGGGQAAAGSDHEREHMASAEERVDGVSVEIEGGQLDGSFLAVPPEMPPGAKTELFGEVYVLTVSPDGQAKLIYSDEETAKFRG